MVHGSWDVCAESQLKVMMVKLVSGTTFVDLLSRSLQVQLYEDFAKSRAKASVDDSISTASTEEEEEKPKLKATGHVFQVHAL